MASTLGDSCSGSLRSPSRWRLRGGLRGHPPFHPEGSQVPPTWGKALRGFPWAGGHGIRHPEGQPGCQEGAGGGGSELLWQPPPQSPPQSPPGILQAWSEQQGAAWEAPGRAGLSARAPGSAGPAPRPRAHAQAEREAGHTGLRSGRARLRAAGASGRLQQGSLGRRESESPRFPARWAFLCPKTDQCHGPPRPTRS